MIERTALYFKHVSPKETQGVLTKSNILGKRVAPHITEVFLSEEKTLWDPINYGVRDARMAPKQQIQSKSKKKKTGAAKDDGDEAFWCQVPGCKRSTGFVNQRELDNHLSARHGEQDSLSPQQRSFPIAVRSKPVERRPIHTDGYKYDDHDDGTAQYHASLTAARRDSVDDDLESEIAHSVSAFSQMTMSDIMPYDSTQSAYTESTDAALSDIAETESQEVQMPVRILINWWKDFTSRYIKDHTNGTGQDTDNRQTQGSRQTARRSSSNTQHKRSSSLSSSTTSQKRGPPGSDDEDEGHKKRKLKIPVPKVETIPLKDRPLACPFNKFDNMQFGEGNPAYHVCSTWNSVKTAYLKQHLQRNHCPSPHCCSRCQQVFNKAAELQDHLRQAVSCEIQELDKQKILPDHQDKLGLRNRNAVGMDKEKYWFEVFDTIFPGEREKQGREIDPYYRGPAHEVLERFLRFSEVRLPQVLARARRDLRIESDSTPEKDAELCRIILQEANQAFMTEMANAPKIDLRQFRREPSTLSVIDDTDDAEAEETVKVYDGPRHAQPTIMPSEADFVHMGQSTYLHMQQGNVPSSSSAHHRQVQSQSMAPPPHPTDTVEPSLLTTQPYPHHDSSHDFGNAPFSSESIRLQQLLDDPDFTRAIESVGMYHQSDAGINDYEYVERDPY